MSGNTRQSINVGEKLLSDLVIFSTISSDISLDFHKSIQVVSLKYLMYFFAEENVFAPLRILKLFIRSIVNPFVDIALTLIDSSYK